MTPPIVATSEYFKVIDDRLCFKVIDRWRAIEFLMQEDDAAYWRGIIGARAVMDWETAISKVDDVNLCGQEFCGECPCSGENYDECHIHDWDVWHNQWKEWSKK
jgi:hypothetical protein